MTEEGENNYLARMKHDLKGKDGAIRNYLDCPINKPQEWDEIDITEAEKPFNIEDYIKPNS